MGALFQDLRHAVRVLLKSRGFSAAAIAVLALGIGANSAIFSVVNAVLLRPFPFQESERLVQLFQVPPAASFPGVKRFAISPGNYLDWRSTTRTLDGIAAYGPRQFTLTGIERPEIVRGATVGSDFFSILKVQPELGHFLTADDDQAGRERVAVISHGFWQSHFASSPDALGKALILNGDLYRIIGVAPAGLKFAAWQATAGDVWTG